jgi:Leucine-rich repeat (LRR) protein
VLLLSLSPLLEGINLRNNHLSGSIPGGISQLSLLTELVLSENELTSSIPQLSELTDLGE